MPESQLLLIGVFSIIVLALVAPPLWARFRRARAISRGLSRQQGRTDIDMRLVPTYHSAVLHSRTLPTHTRVVDDATWTDLDLDATFASLDRTVSHIGRQYFYHQLRTPTFDEGSLARQETMIHRFATQPAWSAKTRSLLQALAVPQAAHVVALLYGDLPQRPRGWWLFPVVTVLSLLCLGFAIVWPQSLVIWAAICLTNIALQLHYRPRVRPLIAAFQAIPALVQTARELAALDPGGEAPESLVFRQAATQLAPLRMATSWLLLEPGTANEVAATVYEYVNMLFLLDLNTFAFSTQKLSDARPLMRALFDAIGRVDAGQSVARWREELPRWSRPQFVAPRKHLQVSDAYHPLLSSPVANSLTLEGTGALVTGSNMAGKTTFMRTLGVNAILAQALNTVCASRWHAPFLTVRSSIRRVDSLLDGRSQYLAEVESARALVEAKSEAGQHLFILDEVFRGTNTVERVAAAYAVLKYLTRGTDLVIVATHDLELLPLLGDRFAVYHFRESVTEHSLTFDYLLRPGVSSTRNAIALLKLVGYPEDIVADALSCVDRGT
jgi:hypothetical protein